MRAGPLCPARCQGFLPERKRSAGNDPAAVRVRIRQASSSEAVKTMGKPASGGTSDYEGKRDFSRTPEPRGGKSGGARPIFVIQEHAASSHHFDFRLEVDDTLKSWAVPKGPSTDPRVKRLAVPTEDHPLDYADFEGAIPDGQYGAGEVLLWDRGPYDNVTSKDGKAMSIAEALDHGFAEIVLHGQKLSGGYRLQRMGGAGEDWLLIKSDDDAADARRNPVSTEPESVKTGRSIGEIGEREDG